MKKLLSLLLTLATLLAVLTACSGPGSDDPNSTTTRSESVTDSTTPSDNESDTSTKTGDQPSASEDETAEPEEDGLTVNMTRRGVVSSEETPSDFHIIVSGKTCEFPADFSQLLSDGWKIPDNVDQTQTFKAKTVTNLYTSNILLPNGSQVELTRIYNDSDSPAILAETQMQGLRFWCDSNSDFDLILPGGITDHSTAADIWEVYGDPAHSPYFQSGSIGESSLSYYSWNYGNEITYNFNFNDDGSIWLIHIYYDMAD